MNSIKYFFIFLFIISCSKEDSIDTPSYLQIDNISLNNGESHNICDAWVYINDQLQGVYELPAKFPILASGSQSLRVRAGIKDNGISSSRIPYPFYKSFTQEVNFIEEETIIINPIIEYQNFNPNYLIEDFDDNSTQIDTTSQSEIDFVKIDENGNKCAYAALTDSLYRFQITTEKLEQLPQGGAPVYLELDYKSNTRFLVGVFINYPLVIRKDLLFVNPKENWNKIYVNLTGTISEAISAPSFSIFVEMVRDYDLSENEIYFDNLKVIY